MTIENFSAKKVDDIITAIVEKLIDSLSIVEILINKTCYQQETCLIEQNTHWIEVGYEKIKKTLKIFRKTMEYFDLRWTRFKSCFLERPRPRLRLNNSV
jgi:hypothetical protein